MLKIKKCMCMGAEQLAGAHKLQASKEASVDSHSFAVGPRAKGVFGMAL